LAVGLLLPSAPTTDHTELMASRQRLIVTTIAVVAWTVGMTWFFDVIDF
jgi:hypothetical protein